MKHDVNLCILLSNQIFFKNCSFSIFSLELSLWIWKNAISTENLWDLPTLLCALGLFPVITRGLIFYHRAWTDWLKLQTDCTWFTLQLRFSSWHYFYSFGFSSVLPCWVHGMKIYFQAIPIKTFRTELTLLVGREQCQVQIMFYESDVGWHRYFYFLNTRFDINSRHS